MLEVLWVALAYVLGSVPWGLVIAKTFCHLDPRESGSRNTGATNVARLCGFGWGVVTLACDVCKGAVPVWLAFRINPSPVFVSVVGLACVLGHVFSCFMKFKGGKAVATSIGVFLPLAFWQLLAASALCCLVIDHDAQPDNQHQGLGKRQVEQHIRTQGGLYECPERRFLLWYFRVFQQSQVPGQMYLGHNEAQVANGQKQAEEFARRR